jgi:aryl-alcohol dehydrogenase-like predicted oxidoreductase
MQDHYNLLYREEEREMLPCCASEGIAVLPWSPLARGRLTRAPETTTPRSESDRFGKTLYGQSDADALIIGAVGQIATKRGVPRARVALAWLLSKSVVAAPIVGATKAGHLDDAIAALDLVLTQDEIAALEAPYRPKEIAGHA